MANKVVLLGNLGSDPEIRYKPDGDAVANLSIATSESWKDQQGQKQERTEWHKVVLWRRLAQVAGEYLKKGDQVYIEGMLQTRKWQAEDGGNRYTTEVVASKLEFTSSKPNNNSNAYNPDGSPKSPQQMRG